MVLLLLHVKDCPRPVAETSWRSCLLRRSLERPAPFPVKQRVEQLGFLVRREVENVADGPSVFAGEEVDFKGFIFGRVSTV